MTESSIVPLRDGAADGFVITTRDVTDRRRLRAELAAAGSRDRLTGLSNRDTFVERLREMVPLAQPQGLAVVALDVIGFRDLNDSRGHEAGDLVLKAVAGGLDALPGTLAVAARFAGDEFTAVVIASSVDAEVAGIDRELRRALQRVVLPDGHYERVGYHLGYAVLTDPMTTAADLLERADLALREARSTGSERVRYSDDLRAGLVTRLRAEADLREALDGGAVVVHYQPVVRLLDGALVGVEALVRLRATDGSLVPPVEFIARAEQLGLVERVGDIVLDQALNDVGLIGAAFGGVVSMAVNVSPSQLGPHLVERVGTLLVSHGVEAQRLIIELTEETLAENHTEAAAVLARLRERGVGVALDDFGTGYSSLAYLAGLPVDELKIDRSFVSQMGTSPTSLTLVRSVVQLAQALDLVTVAEGVETLEQADLLRGMRCQLAQGYLYARPMPLDDLLALSRGGVHWLGAAVEGDAGTPSTAPAPALDVHSGDDR